MKAPQRDENEQTLALAQALADALRLSILQHLMSGPASVSELLSLTGEAQSKVSNHLALLRERGLVEARREGRQVVYQLADGRVGQLVESLTALAGGKAAPPKQWKSPQMVQARTCYDHLAGRFGVALFDALVAQDALKADESVAAHGNVELGAAAQEVFGNLGIDLAALRRERRRFATACLDWTERRPHLGGALGAALWTQCVERGWIVKQPGTRAVIVTEAGSKALREYLGVEVKEEAVQAQ